MKKQILSEEFKRMQKLAGLVNESQLNGISTQSIAKANDFWKSLGKGYYVEDDIYYTPYGFIFSYDPETYIFSSEIQYSDYGNSREEGEAKIDPMLNEFETILEKKHQSEGIGWRTRTTSYAYLVTIDIDTD